MKTEFRRFPLAIVLLACQILRTALGIVWRVFSEDRWLTDSFATLARIVTLEMG